MSSIERNEEKRAKLVTQFDDYYFSRKPKLSSKLVKTLLIGNRKSRLRGVLYYLNTLHENKISACAVLHLVSKLLDF